MTLRAVLLSFLLLGGGTAAHAQTGQVSEIFRLYTEYDQLTAGMVVIDQNCYQRAGLLSDVRGPVNNLLAVTEAQCGPLSGPGAHTFTSVACREMVEQRYDAARTQYVACLQQAQEVMDRRVMLMQRIADLRAAAGWRDVPGEFKFTMDDSSGAMVVADVLRNGGAKRSGLRRGDQIVGVAGYGVRDMKDLGRMLNRIPPGVEVPLNIVRKGKNRLVALEDR